MTGHTMKEAFAVTGYVADDIANQLQAKGSGKIDVKVERGYEEIMMRVDQADVVEVRIGSSVNNEALVQLILRDGATVETVIRTPANTKGLSRFHDPILARLTAQATAKVIAV
jgi:hypothetical protein